jgi:hypothetical protein
MNPTRRTSLTLSAALLLGVALGLAGPRGERQSNDAAKSSSVGAVASVTDAGSSVPRAGNQSYSVPSSAASTSDAYAAAWELLKDGKLRREERRNLESDLLEVWAKIDLRAALHAAYEEEGTDEEDPFEVSPLDACFEGIRSQPDLVWELVSSWEYGLHTRELRKAWITHVGYQNPLKLLEHFTALPAEPMDSDEDPREQAVRMALTGCFEKGADPKLADAVLAKLGSLAADGDQERIVSSAASFLPLWIPENRHLEFLRGATTPVAREIHLRAYASLIQVYLSNGMEEKLDDIPTEFRAEVLARLGRRPPLLEK